MVVAHNELGVNENVTTEDQSGQSAVDQLAGAAVGEEHGHEAKQEQTPESAEEVGHPAGEVIFGLAGEGCQEDEDARGKQHGVEDDGGVVDGDDDGDGICFEKGETGEEEKICRIGVALPVGQEHEADGAEQL